MICVGIQPPLPGGERQADEFDDEEMRRALAESAEMAKQKDMTDLVGLFSEDTVPDVTQVNITRQNYGESLAVAINEKQRSEREIEMVDLFGGDDQVCP